MYVYAALVSVLFFCECVVFVANKNQRKYLFTAKEFRRLLANSAYDYFVVFSSY